MAQEQSATTQRRRTDTLKIHLLFHQEVKTRFNQPFMNLRCEAFLRARVTYAVTHSASAFESVDETE